MKKTIRNGKRYAFVNVSEDGILTITVSALNWLLCDPFSTGYGRPERRIRIATHYDGVREIRIIDNSIEDERKFEFFNHSGAFFAKVRA